MQFVKIHSSNTSYVQCKYTSKNLLRILNLQDVVVTKISFFENNSIVLIEMRRLSKTKKRVIKTKHTEHEGLCCGLGRSLFLERGLTGFGMGILVC